MLPSEIVKQVRRIQFQTGRHVADMLAGQYLSVFGARGMEFDEVRPHAGRRRSHHRLECHGPHGAPFVKRFQEERELTVLLVVDISASQNFGSAGRSKRQAAVELSALLAFRPSTTTTRSASSCSTAESKSSFHRAKGQKHALRVVREVLARGIDADLSPAPTAAASERSRSRLPIWMRQALSRLRRSAGPVDDPRRRTNLAGAMGFCRRILPRRAVVFLISDFLDEGYLPALRSVNRRHDVVAVLVGDERESSFPHTGLLTLEDAETGATQTYDTSSAAFQRGAYRRCGRATAPAGGRSAQGRH